MDSQVLSCRLPYTDEMVVLVVVVPVPTKMKIWISCLFLWWCNRSLTKSRPNSVQVCWIIFASHFSFGSGGGVPAIGCGRGRVVVPALVVFVDGRGAIGIK